MKVLVVLTCLLGLAIAADPARPNLSDVFYAKLNVATKDGDNYWRGGGIWANDYANGNERTDFVLNGNLGYQHVQILNRFDMNTTFILDDNHCEKYPYSKPVDPWAWIEKATYTGNSSFQGNNLNVWTYQSGMTTTSISVLASDPTKPVVQSVKLVNGSYISENIWTFLEFDTTIPGDWVFYIPSMCQNGSQVGAGASASDVVYFANNNWDCADVSCSSRVAAGSGQPGYECAEFVARSLAYGGYIPIAWNAPQSDYLSWRGYDLCLTTSLASALAALGFQKLANSGGSVSAAVAIFGNAGDGSFSHTCIGVAGSTVDCHNNARLGVSAAGTMYLGIDAVYGP